jgi:hypothetical protein
MTPQSIPKAADVIETRPKHVGLVYQCDSCHAPVFLRFATKSFTDDRVELYRNFVELERPKERFAFSYLPKHTEVLFREALSCYSTNNFNAFASMCRRSASSAYAAGEEELLPLLNRVQAGILLEVMKDMLYQCFVRRGKLTRALKVRRFFVQENDGDLASSA